MNYKIKIIVVFLVSYLSLSGLFYFITPQYARIYLPFIKNMLNEIYPEYFQFSSVQIGKNGRTIKCETILKGEVIKDGRPVRAEIKGKHSLQISFIALSPAIALSFIICWPNVSWKIRTFSLIVVTQLIFCITILDLSFTLMSSIETQLSFGSAAQDFRKFIIKFLNNGGRQFISIIIAWASILVARWGVD